MDSRVCRSRAADLLTESVRGGQEVSQNSRIGGGIGCLLVGRSAIVLSGPRSIIEKPGCLFANRDI